MQEKRRSFDLQAHHATEVPQLGGTERALIPVGRGGRGRHRQHEGDVRTVCHCRSPFQPAHAVHVRGEPKPQQQRERQRLGSA